VIKPRLIKIAVSTGGLFTLLAFSGTALATAQDITMSPTTVSQVIQPGTTVDGNFLVIDQGKSAYNFQVYATPYHVIGEDYTPDFTILPNAPKVVSWFKFSTAGESISPGQTKSVGYSITMPKNTTPGGYYAVAFAETKFPQSGNSITLNERVGEVFYIEAAGPVVKKGQLLTWSVPFFQKPPLTSTMRVEDSGGINFPTTINVKVEDAFGQAKYTLATVKQILPQTIRRIIVPWALTPSLGLFKVTGTVSFLSTRTTLPTRWVLVMSPTVQLAFGLIALLIILIFVFGEWRKMRAKRQIKQETPRHPDQPKVP